jgi:hypothetical protein
MMIEGGLAIDVKLAIVVIAGWVLLAVATACCAVIAGRVGGGQ